MENKIIKYYDQNFKYYMIGIIMGCISTCLYVNYPYYIYITLSTILVFMVYVLTKRFSK